MQANFWSRSQLLVPGSLVLLCDGSRVMPAIIEQRRLHPQQAAQSAQAASWREPAHQATPQSTRVGVALSFCHQDDVELALEQVAMQPSARTSFQLLQPEQSFLIDVVQYVLAALQSARAVCPPFANVLVHHQQPRALAPALCPSESLVQDVLAQRSAGEAGVLQKSAGPTQSNAGSEGTMQPRLAAEQQAALQAALRNNVALITGAPGTGKATVMFALVRALAAHADAHAEQAECTKAPVVLALYRANHNLDTFLHSLVVGGLPLRQILRIGGGCHDPVLESRSLFNMPEWNQRELAGMQVCVQSFNRQESDRGNQFTNMLHCQGFLMQRNKARAAT